MDIKNKIQFISFAISDTQQLIKNIDAKLTVVITILGAYILAFFSKTEAIICNVSYYSVAFRLVMIAFIILVIICVFLTAKILIPAHNPKDNVLLGSKDIPKLDFFLAENHYPKGNTYLFKNSAKSKLKIHFDKYSDILANTEDDGLLDSLTFEFFKLSYIRNIKYKRLKVLLLFLVATTILFFISFIWFTVESLNQ